MATCTSIQVLCPNGRRQTVKVTPSTTLLQALEEVCKKQNFLPPEDYNFVHGRKILDLTLTFRFSNLSNNAKLELVKAKMPRAVSDVLIALQLEAGERLQHQFTPATSLWEILQHWDNHRGSDVLCAVDSSLSPPRHPVCIYLGEETVGEFALRETTLKKLGLTGGKAIIRLIHRAVDDLTIAQSIESVEKERIKQARLDEKVDQYLASAQRQVASPSPMTPAHSEAVNTAADSAGATQTPEAMEVDGPSAGPSTETAVSRQQGATASQPQSRADSRQAAGPSDTGQSTAQGLTALESLPGVQVFRPSDFYDLSPQEQEIARRLAQRLMPQLGLVPAASQGAISRNTPSQSFADFKFPEDTKGKTLYQNEYSEVNRTEFQPCDREAVVFSADEPRSTQSTEDLPDDFFDVTVSDVQNMLSDYQNKLQDMTDQPLLTQAMRRNQAQQKLSKYQRAVIRIQFPDKWVLQALFRPRETVFAVQKFVKEHLEDKSIPFQLYTSPPKQVLKDNTKNLLEANLVPATVVYFSSEVKRDHYLSSAVLQEVSSLAAADAIVAKNLHGSSNESEMPSTSQGPSTSQRSSSNRDTGQRSVAANPTGTDSSSKGQKMPKWFMKGKK